jgi:hypothetical protein
VKTEETCSSETSVDFGRTTWCYIPEDRTFKVTLIGNSGVSFITYSIFRTIQRPLLFSRVPFQSYYQNDTPWPTFKAISHEQHTEIVNREPSPLHSILHVTYIKLPVLAKQTQHTEREDCSPVRDPSGQFVAMATRNCMAAIYLKLTKLVYIPQDTGQDVSSAFRAEDLYAKLQFL